MYYNYYKDVPKEYEDFFAKGSCSKSPALSSLQEVIMLHLKELAFYLLELKQLGAYNKKINEHILNALSGVVIDVEYNEEQYRAISFLLQDNLVQAKMVYGELCKRDNIEPKFFGKDMRLNKKNTLADAIKKGEKYILKKHASLSVEEKQLFDITFFLLKSMCIKMVELKNLGKENEEAYFVILSMLKEMTINELTIKYEEKKSLVEEYIEFYYEMVNQVYETQVEIYGEESPVEVSLSSRQGKAILVAGSDFKELEMVLMATEGKNIDVYTHGLEMLMAHTFPKFKEYKHLVGHFSRNVDACLIDFANFPGPVLMTRHSLHKTQNIYRAIIFTTDVIPPQGATKIENNDFEPLIKAALESKGFSKATEKGTIKAGWEDKEVSGKIHEVLDKVEGNKIKQICFVGLLNEAHEQSEYFEKLFGVIPKDSFIFSLSYKYSGENIYHVDSFYDYSLIYKILKEIKKRKPLDTIEVTVFITKCDKYTVSNILTLKQMGVKNIYMCKCSPMLVSPALISAIRSFFGVEEFVDPVETLEKALGGGPSSTQEENKNG